jgi:hypothetical protein
MHKPCYTGQLSKRAAASKQQQASSSKAAAAFRLPPDVHPAAQKSGTVPNGTEQGSSNNIVNYNSPFNNNFVNYNSPLNKICLAMWEPGSAPYHSIRRLGVVLASAGGTIAVVSVPFPIELRVKALLYLRHNAVAKR